MEIIYVHPHKQPIFVPDEDEDDDDNEMKEACHCRHLIHDLLVSTGPGQEPEQAARTTKAEI